MKYQINIYEIQENGRCKVDLDLIDLNLFISGFVVVPGPNGKGVIVHMPKGMGTDWQYKEIEWAYVRSIISGEYLKNSQICEILNSLYANKTQAERTLLLSTKAKNQEKPQVQVEPADLFVNLYNFDAKSGDCMAGIILPKSKICIEGFKVKNEKTGGISVYMPQLLGTIWRYDEISWKNVRQKITQQYQKEREYVDTIFDVDERKDFDKKTEEVSLGDIEKDTVEKKEEMSEKKKQNLLLKNRMRRLCNAENAAFAFVPHSVLKLVDVSIDYKGLTRRIVNAINSPKGGIGPLEIEILEWVSKFKYVVKTMILDLVLSGYISLGERNSITADKMSNIMNRLYKYDLIESSNFVAVDDDGNPLSDGGYSIYRVHTLGATGYNLLREMGRHPERRNPFGVLADGNTVKKHLSANQWLVYWLTHYAQGDILDYSVNTNINLIGSKWNGARIYASINLGTISIIAEPVRRCEDFERESDVVAVREKLLRVIELFDNEDQLYTSTREQIVYPIRPIISFVCEDDEHMKEVAECVQSIVEQYKQQEVWFTTDIRMFNYDCKGERFFELEDGKMTVINLEEKIGLEEMSMEERGGWATEMQVN